MKFLLWLIVIGIILRLIANYIIPIFRITSATNDRLRQMQEQLKDMDSKMNEPKRSGKKVNKDGDYIDYEEIR